MIYNFNPFPVLETERLLLRKPEATDVDDLFEIRSNADTMRFIPRPVAQSPQEVADLLNVINTFLESNEKINWAMQLKSTGKFIGLIGYVDLKPYNYRGEIGYVINENYRRRHLMEEAASRIVEYGFSEMSLHSIEAIVHPENVASQKLLKKLLFRRDGYHKHFQLSRGQFVDALSYSRISPYPFIAE